MKPYKLTHYLLIDAVLALGKDERFRDSGGHNQEKEEGDAAGGLRQNARRGKAQGNRRNLPTQRRKELLISYLEHDPPLHCRRTLDQYYYHTLANTSRRDKDQTAMRHFRDDNDAESPPPDEIITMVDQLWMWVLPPCGSSPSTVITAFPQGGFRKPPTNATALVNNITETFLRSEEPSCNVLAEAIVGECLKIYLEPKTSWDARLQFLEIYNSSIAQIVRPLSLLSHRTLSICTSNAITPKLDRDAERYIEFRQSQDVTSKRKSESSNIKEEIRDLGHIKDIRDELGIMTVLLYSRTCHIYSRGLSLR